MNENLFCSGQKTLSKEGKKNWDKIFIKRTRYITAKAAKCIYQKGHLFICKIDDLRCTLVNGIKCNAYTQE